MSSRFVFSPSVTKKLIKIAARRTNGKLIRSRYVSSMSTLNLPTLAGVGDSEKDSIADSNLNSNKTQALQLEANEGFSNIVESSALCLKNGGVIAVPTDTIYGVACLVQNTSAVERIYAIKGRNQEKPIAISVGTIEDVYKWSKVTVPEAALKDLLPGPVTVVFERRPELNPALNPYTSLVGVRIPDHTFMMSLAKQCGSPIALTSANISGTSSCLKVQEFENLWSRLNLIVNGGTLHDTEESRLGSTVVDLSVPGTFKIIRPGSAHMNTKACLQDKYKLEQRFSDVSPSR